MHEIGYKNCRLKIQYINYTHRARNPGKQLNKSKAENVRILHFPEDQQKIQRHFYRAHACFVKYFLMTKKSQQTKKIGLCDYLRTEPSPGLGRGDGKSAVKIIQ